MGAAGGARDLLAGGGLMVLGIVPVGAPGREVPVLGREVPGREVLILGREVPVPGREVLMLGREVLVLGREVPLLGRETISFKNCSTK